MTQSTATATTTTIQATEDTESLFVAKCINQKMFVRQPYLHVQNGIPVFVPGKSIEFVNHEYRTSDPEEKAFIRNHRLFGTQITEVTPGDLGRAVKREHPNMQRGAMTTKPTNPQVSPKTDEEGSSKDDYAALIEEALEKNLEAKVGLPCGFPGCEYVALGEDESSAKRALNGHRTVRGHHAPKGKGARRTG